MKWASVLVPLVVYLATPAGARAGTEETVKAGYVSSAVHPGDPLKEIRVVGFVTQEEALSFVNGGFEKGNLTPRIEAALTRGQHAAFAGAHFLVFYHLWEGKPELLSLARCHADLHLVLGSCGFQLTLGVITVAQPTAAPPQSRPRR